MKKKVVYFLLSLFLCFGVFTFNEDKVYAVGSEAAPKVKINTIGSRTTGGYFDGYYWTYRNYIEYKTVETSSYSGAVDFATSSQAVAWCKKVFPECVNSATCTCSSQKKMMYYCSGNYYDSASSCKSIYNYGTCTYHDARNASAQYYTCSLNTSKYYNTFGKGKTNCTSACKASKCTCSYTLARYVMLKKTLGTVAEQKSLPKQQHGAVPLYLYRYAITSNGVQDPTYCIQPGSAAPGGSNYCLNENVDISVCKTVNDYYFCGMGLILSHTTKEVTGADGKKTYVYKTASDSGYYSYDAVTIALRMWSAYWVNHKGTASNIMSNTDGLGYESPEKFNYISNTPVYGNTVEKVLAGYTGGNVSIADGVMYTKNGYNEYIKGIELFKKAYSEEGATEFFESLSNDAEYPKPKVTTSRVTDEGGTIEIDLPEKFSEIQVACTKDELLGKVKNNGCKVIITIKDEKGNKVDDSRIKSGWCDKEHCTIEIEGTKTCEKYEKKGTIIKWSYTVTLNDWGGKAGFIRQYVNCAGENKTQVMMTFSLNQKNLEETSADYIPSTSVSGSIYIKCPCDETKKCSNFDPIENLPESCEGDDIFGKGEYDTYVKGTKEDPYMNCILNACYAEDAAEYNFSEKYGVNTEVCDIYCREDITFYLANKTRVYAGMQFSYDIGTKLIQDGELDSTLTTDYKLTSIVLQKRQCTSEIYYDQPDPVYGKTWLQRYDAAVKAMITAYNSWKHAESLYDWQMKDNGGKPDEVTGEGKQCYRGTGCGGDCVESTYLNPIKYVLYWPDQGTNEKYDKYTITSGATVGLKFNLTEGSGTNSTSSGSYNSASGCSSSGCDCYCHCTGTPEAPACCYSCDDTRVSTTGSCTAGSAGNYDVAKNAEDAAFRAYTATVDKVEQLLYDLQNCNMYVQDNDRFAEKIASYYNNVVTAYHGTYSAKVTSAKKDGLKNISTKDYVLKEASCTDPEKCIDLNVEYADKNYGKETLFGKEIGIIDSVLNNNYYCKNSNDSNPNCYKYIKDTEVEIQNGNSLVGHELVKCTGTRTNTNCYTENKNLPTNDYATFIAVTEADFWQPKKYQVESYTGLVSEGEGTESSNKYAPLGKNIYPVSSDKNSGVTGSYDISYEFTKISASGSNKFQNYNYSCSYDVYNVTNLYDCEISYKDNKLDISGCANTCYDIIEGVPVIQDGCNAWSDENTSTKGYGFIFRNVDLKNMFPSTRKVGNNWNDSKAQTVINSISSTADKLYVDPNLLEYSFTLTPQAIKSIREYNDSKESGGGGYMDNSLYSCRVDTDTKGLKYFNNCKSYFLETSNLNSLGIDEFYIKVGDK